MAPGVERPVPRRRERERDRGMSAESFCQWLRLQGFTVLRTASSYWYTEGFGVYQAFPYHSLIQPSSEELSTLFGKGRATVLRYSGPPDSGSGTPSYHIIFEGSSYGFDNLGYRTRKNVRRGLRSCQVSPIPFERVAEEGWALHLDTLTRQERRRGWSHETWRKRFRCASDLEGFEAWGAIVGGNLAAYMVSFQLGDCCFILDHKSSRQYLPLNVNNALVFVVTQTLVSRQTVKTIYFAMHSLDAPRSVEEFKEHMGYVQRPVRQCVAFHPFLSPLANPFTHAVVRQLARWVPASARLSKAEGLLSSYLNASSSNSVSPELTT
jgi:hypothetical protein